MSGGICGRSEPCGFTLQMPCVIWISGPRAGRMSRRPPPGRVAPFRAESPQRANRFCRARRDADSRRGRTFRSFARRTGPNRFMRRAREFESLCGDEAAAFSIVHDSARGMAKALAAHAFEQWRGARIAERLPHVRMRWPRGPGESGPSGASARRDGATRPSPIASTRALGSRHVTNSGKRILRRETQWRPQLRRRRGYEISRGMRIESKRRIAEPVGGRFANRLEAERNRRILIRAYSNRVSLRIGDDKSLAADRWE